MSRGKVKEEEIITTVDRERIAAGARSNYYLTDWRETIQKMDQVLIDRILESPSMFSAGKHPLRDAP